MTENNANNIDGAFEILLQEVEAENNIVLSSDITYGMGRAEED